MPVPTYVLGANKEDHVKLFSNNSDELCSNVYYLGKRGLYLSSGGLKIAYLSGISKNPNDKLNEEYAYNFEDAQTLKDLCLKGDAAYRGVDILLTSQWPNNVMNGDINGRVHTSIIITQTCLTLKLKLFKGCIKRAIEL